MKAEELDQPDKRAFDLLDEGRSAPAPDLGVESEILPHRFYILSNTARLVVLDVNDILKKGLEAVNGCSLSYLKNYCGKSD